MVAVVLVVVVVCMVVAVVVVVVVVGWLRHCACRANPFWNQLCVIQEAYDSCTRTVSSIREATLDIIQLIGWVCLNKVDFVCVRCYLGNDIYIYICVYTCVYIYT